MRFDKIALRGFGPFRDEVLLDLGAIDGRIVAVTGDNGAGKSTLLELLPGALYRDTPTRGTLASLATERNAYLEVHVTNGAGWTLRHTVDATSGKGEALVLDDAGLPALGDVKVRSFDAWSATHLTPAAVLYASSFAPQGSGGFLELKPGDRKGVLLRVLGIEALEAKAERARDRQRAARGALETLAARMADERERGGDIAAAEQQVAEARAMAEEADRALAAVRAELALVERRLAEHQQARRDAAAAEERRRQHDEAVTQAKRKAIDLAQRVENNRALLDKAAEVRAAVARAAEIDPAIETAKAECSALEARRTVLEGERDQALIRSRDVLDRRTAATERARRAEARLFDRARVTAAVAQLDTLRVAVGEAEADEVAAARLVEAARGKALGVASRRIGGLRDGLGEIAEMSHDRASEDAPDLACDILHRDDQTEADAEAAPAEAARLAEDLEAARAETAERRRALADAERLAARAGEMAGAAAELAAATGEVAAADADAKKAGVAVTAARNALGEAERALITVEAVRADLVAERLGLAPLIRRAEALANATARLGELEPALAEAERDLAALGQVVLPAVPFVPSVDDLERPDVRAAEEDARHAHGMVAVAVARRESAMLTARRLEELEAARRATEDDAADWTLLADSLGREGVQALEIDAAGPELTALINDLLTACVGPRWSVTIETTRSSADGKRVLEGLEVRVLDVERGRDAPVETFSGGERVLLGEAVSLALSMLACRRAGIEGPTLIRDETSASLDPANARAYVGMLRRAADIVNASHVIFVSHSREVQELADARIEIVDGHVRVAA